MSDSSVCKHVWQNASRVKIQSGRPVLDTQFVCLLCGHKSANEPASVTEPKLEYYQVNGVNEFTHERIQWVMLAESSNAALEAFRKVFKDEDGWDFSYVGRRH